MKGPTVADVMTRNVVAVNRSTPLQQVAELMSRHGIDSVPIVDSDGRPVEVISAAEMITPEQAEAALPAWKRLWRRLRGIRPEATATGTAAIAPDMATIAPDACLSLAARRLERGSLRNLLVVDADGRLVGVFSRSDALRSFLRSDADIRAATEREVIRFALGLTSDEVQVHVAEGVVTLTGSVKRRSETQVAGTLSERLPGVVGVRNRLQFATDDRISAPAWPSEIEALALHPAPAQSTGGDHGRRKRPQPQPQSRGHVRVA
jgi:CBS domain-containing protein